MPRRARRVAGAALASAALVALAPTVVAASGGTSGSAAAIRLYRQATSTMNHLVAYVVHQYGYVRISDSIGKKRELSWAWGNDQFQPGEVATTERLVLVQRRGAVAWLEDLVRPARTCAQGGQCPTVLPIEFVITPSAAFAGIVSSSSQSTAPCFERAALANVPYAAGGPWWFVGGTFAAPVHQGARTEITLSYANAGQRQVERDWVLDGSHTFARSTFADAARGRHRAFNFGGTYTVLHSAPTFPRVSLCS